MNSGQRERTGLLLGLIGVVIFSATLPVTRIALTGLDPLFVAYGRAALAGLVAAAALKASGARRPSPAEARDIALAALGIVFGWPALNSYALQLVPSTHSAMVNGVLPLATAAIGAYVAGERPSLRFWAVALLGAATVTGYAWQRGGASLHLADGLLAVGVLLGGMGYALGARASKTLPGWQVISWALVFSLPFTLLIGVQRAPTAPAAVGVNVWLAFLYLALLSQYIGFFFWYKGLALGGIARVSQVQLLQLFLTLLIAWGLLGEALDGLTLACAAATVLIVAVGRRQPVVPVQRL